MDHFNAVKATVTSGGSGNVTVSTTGIGKGRPLSTLPIGWTGGLRFDDPNGVDWELSICTMLSATILSRDTLLCGSNGTSKVNLAAGSTVVQLVVAEQLNAFRPVSSIPFSTSVPLSSLRETYMNQFVVGGPLTFTPAAAAVRGALVWVRLVADGTNTPNLSAFKESTTSSGYDNRAGILNIIQFIHDGYDALYSVSGIVGATAVDLTPPSSASALVANGSPSVVAVTASENLDAGYLPAAASFVVGGHTVTSVVISGSTIYLTCSTAFVNGEAARAVAYTQPGANGVRDLAGNLMGSFSAMSITNNVGVVQSAPSQMVAPVASANAGSASIILSAPNANNAAITGYTVTSSPAGGVDSAAGTTALTRTIAGLTGGVSYTFTATATNGIGTSPASPSSNSVVPTAVTTLRLGGLVNVTESGSAADYTYTAPDVFYTTTSAGPGGMVSKLFGAGDARVSLVLSAFGSPAVSGPILGLIAGSSLTPYPGVQIGLYAQYDSVDGSNPRKYLVILNGTTAPATGNGAALLPAAGDIMQLRRTGTTLYLEVARAASPSSFTVIHTVSGFSTSTFYIGAFVAKSNAFHGITGDNLVDAPIAPAGSPRLASLVSVAESGTTAFTYTGTDALHYAADTPGPGGILVQAFQDDVDGSFSFASATIQGVYNETILGVLPGSSLVGFAHLPYSLYTQTTTNPAQYKAISNGSIAVPNTAALQWAAGDIQRVRRTGSTLYFEVARAGNPTSFTVLQVYAGVSTGVLHIQLMISGTANASALTLSGLA
ncbi:MAG: hypothetical protein M3Y65_11750 [Pseudomonadota bacterium]|nr:hypothetical protein [Pseudomonadota bacterium]